MNETFSLWEELMNSFYEEVFSRMKSCFEIIQSFSKMFGIP